MDNQNVTDIDIAQTYEDARQCDFQKKHIKYTSDGLSENEYQRSDVINDNLMQSECCGKYFKYNAYMHQTKYKLSVVGMHTCIHCFHVFNNHKYEICKDVSENELNCLKYYLNNFTNEHDVKKCITCTYTKCFLCDSKNGIFPMSIENDVVERHICANKRVINEDVLYVKKANPHTYIMEV